MKLKLFHQQESIVQYASASFTPVLLHNQHTTFFACVGIRRIKFMAENDLHSTCKILVEISSAIFMPPLEEEGHTALHLLVG
jgi:hypothetical protein